MAKLNYESGVTSVILRVNLTNSSTGAPLTGLTSASAGLIVSTIADNESSATVYAQASSNTETITTLGTFATPTSGKCRFKEVDATNHPGVYEVQIADARWAVSNARSVIVSLSGATNLLATHAEIQLKPVPANMTQVNGSSASGSGTPDVNVTKIIGKNYPGYAGTVTGTPSTTVFRITVADDIANDVLIGHEVSVFSSTGVPRGRQTISDSARIDATTQSLTIDTALIAAPTVGDIAIIQ